MKINEYGGSSETLPFPDNDRLIIADSGTGRDGRALGLRHGWLGYGKAAGHIGTFINRCSKCRSIVLIMGESGTGKGRVARAIHAGSRADGTFVAVNCSAIPDTLFESEMFGSEAGAFTGAHKRPGYFEQAHNGTLFLDEVGDLTYFAQAKLLHAVEDMRFFAVGGGREKQVSARLIFATNKNLDQLVIEGSFREDLYHRLMVLTYTLPPLRERREDIGHLSWSFLKEFAGEEKMFTTAAVDKLVNHSWSGNVRELRNCIERAVVYCNDDMIDADKIFFVAPVRRGGQETKNSPQE